MPFVIAAETAGEIQCLMELLKDEDIQLTIVDGFEFGDAIEELKEKKLELSLVISAICHRFQNMKSTFPD